MGRYIITIAKYSNFLFILSRDNKKYKMYCHTKLLAMLAFGFILGPLFLRAKYLLVQLKDEINVDRYNDPVRAIKPIINKSQSRRVECGNDAECDAVYGDEKDSCNAQGECEVYTCGHDNMLECLIRYGVGDKGFAIHLQIHALKWMKIGNNALNRETAMNFAQPET